MERTDPVEQAMAKVQRDLYCFESGRQLPQTSAPGVIAEVLRLLAVSAAERVMEVGTGSGYSTALLAELVGPRGQVVSIDVDAEMTSRAARLLQRDGYAQVEVLTADGRAGLAERAPYHRIVAWAAVLDSVIPSAWIDQLAVGGVLVLPMRLQDRPLVVRYVLTPMHDLIQTGQAEAGFAPLTPEPFRPWENEEWWRHRKGGSEEGS